MKIIAILSLSLLMLMQPLSKMLIVADYQVNKNYIATVLCVNKDNPQLHCEGKCHLSRELARAQESEQDIPAIFSLKAEMPFIIQVFSVDFLQVTKQSAVAYTPYTRLFPTPSVSGIFQPPRF